MSDFFSTLNAIGKEMDDSVSRRKLNDFIEDSERRAKNEEYRRQQEEKDRQENIRDEYYANKSLLGDCENNIIIEIKDAKNNILEYLQSEFQKLDETLTEIDSKLESLSEDTEQKFEDLNEEISNIKQTLKNVDNNTKHIQPCIVENLSLMLKIAKKNNVFDENDLKAIDDKTPLIKEKKNVDKKIKI